MITLWKPFINADNDVYKTSVLWTMISYLAKMMSHCQSMNCTPCVATITVVATMTYDKQISSECVLKRWVWTLVKISFPWRRHRILTEFVWGIILWIIILTCLPFTYENITSKINPKLCSLLRYWNRCCQLEPLGNFAGINLGTSVTISTSIKGITWWYFNFFISIIGFQYLLTHWMRYSVSAANTFHINWVISFISRLRNIFW